MMEIKKFTFNPFQENTYVVFDESKEAVIIDAGCNTVTEEKELADFISDNQLKPKYLLNTHCHVDHMLGNDFVFRKYGLRTYMHKADMPVLTSTPQYGALFGIQVTPSPDPEGFLEEGDKVEFGNSTFDILFIPGHSPGHIAFVNHEQKFVIGGDILFQGSIGRTDLPMGDHDTLIRNIQEKLMVLDPDFEVFAGHGPSTKIGFEKKNNPFIQDSELASRK